MIFEKFSKKEISIVLGLSLIYMVWVCGFVGLRDDHIYFWSACLLAYFASPVSRKVLLCLIPIILYWIIYDSTRIYPNYLFNPVHLEDLYQIEKLWFGIPTPEGILTPNEYFQINNWTLADVLAGSFYLCWVPVPLMFALWLFFKDRKLMLQFSFVFFLVNFLGIIVYYLYPAAPPWYVELHGFEKNFNIPGNEAGLAAFDQFFGINFYHGMYAKNANVFAAVPSLHSAFPVLTLYFGIKKKVGWMMNIVFASICLGIWFAAVYTRHHYILDVLLGISCAILALVLFELLMKIPRVQMWLERYVKVVS